MQVCVKLFGMCACACVRVCACANYSECIPVGAEGDVCVLVIHHRVHSGATGRHTNEEKAQ